LKGPIRVFRNADRYQGDSRHGVEVVGVLFGEVAGIADADDAS
jgi:hypothetical protein